MIFFAMLMTPSLSFLHLEHIDKVTYIVSLLIKVLVLVVVAVEATGFFSGSGERTCLGLENGGSISCM